MDLNTLLSKLETKSDNVSNARYITNVINEVTYKIANDCGRKPSTYFSPSSLGGCERSIYYKITGAPTDDKLDIKVKNLKKGNSGTDRHLRIQKALLSAEKYGYNLKWIDIKKYANERGMDYLHILNKDETEYHIIDKRYNLSFKTDGLLKVKNQYLLIEIKTDDTYRWGRRNDISSYHEIQGICYSLSFNIPWIVYIYEERNEFKLKPIMKKITKEQKTKVKDKLNKLTKYKNKKQLPDTEKNKCMFCSYKYICKKNLNVNSY